jgi:hypothetical protein
MASMRAALAAMLTARVATAAAGMIMLAKAAAAVLAGGWSGEGRGGA